VRRLYNKPELAAAHALAAQYLGMRFVYLEAGSGAKQPVPSEMVRIVKELVSIPLVVGGGIKAGEQVRGVVNAGAKVIVTGTVVEGCEVKDKVGEIVKNMKSLKAPRTA